MERTEQMYTIQKQMDFGKIKVWADHMFLHFHLQRQYSEYRVHMF